MYQLVYEDRKGASCAYYPRDDAEAQARMKSLARRGTSATLVRNGHQVGAVERVDEGNHYRWHYWYWPTGARHCVCPVCEKQGR